MIEPLQSLLTQGVHVMHILDVEDITGTGEKVAGNPQEFLHPISRESALENKHRTILTIWKCDS